MATTKPNQLRLYCPFKKTKFCEFGPIIQDMLRDLLVVNVDCVCIYGGEKKKLNLGQAGQIALAMESADKNVHNIAACSNTTTLTQPNISHINRGNSGQGKSKKTFFRCDSKHSPDFSCFRDTTCNFCQKTGHISAACLKRKGTKGTRNCQTQS